MTYIPSNKDQNWLLPLSIKDIIPKDHICFLLEDFVESLDYSNFDMIYEGAGHPAYHPRIIMKILTYGTLCKTRSSRKLAMAAKENLVFMHLAEKVNPDFRTINRFRKDNPEFVKSGCCKE
jgi:transposase